MSLTSDMARSIRWSRSGRPSNTRSGCTTSGEEGVRLVRHEHPLVVLLDLRMPDMDGFEVAERLRADPETAGVPIIVLTHLEMTRADRDRLAGRVSHLAQKGHLDRAGLVELVGRRGGVHTSEQEADL